MQWLSSIFWQTFAIRVLGEAALCRALGLSGWNE
jgi:hypothetical protein